MLAPKYLPIQSVLYAARASASVMRLEGPTMLEKCCRSSSVRGAKEDRVEVEAEAEVVEVAKVAAEEEEDDNDVAGRRCNVELAANKGCWRWL